MRATREQIVQAAAQAFAESGYHGATLLKVGQRLGISKSAVLYHFASKDHLLDEVLRPLAEETQDFVASYAGPPATAADRLDLVSRLMTLYAGHYDAVLAIHNDRLLWTHGTVARGMRLTYGALVDLLSGSAGDPVTRLRAHAALALSFRAITSGIDLTGPVRDVTAPDGALALRICADVLGG
jgi:AcrR family transcriptional regulator